MRTDGPTPIIEKLRFQKVSSKFLSYFYNSDDENLESFFETTTVYKYLIHTLKRFQGSSDANATASSKNERKYLHFTQ